MDATKGHLRIRVWGPRSANTYGAEAWVRSVQDFHDGRPHTINFTWEARPTIMGHGDYYFIQVTDGFIPARGDFHWPARRPPLKPIREADLKGTADLLVTRIPGCSLIICRTDVALELRPEDIVLQTQELILEGLLAVQDASDCGDNGQPCPLSGDLGSRLLVRRDPRNGP